MHGALYTGGRRWRCGISLSQNANKDETGVRAPISSYGRGSPFDTRNWRDAVLENVPADCLFRVRLEIFRPFRAVAKTAHFSEVLVKDS
jgi:hypothetical protein